jgi:hypothetical protein
LLLFFHCCFYSSAIPTLHTLSELIIIIICRPGVSVMSFIHRLSMSRLLPSVGAVRGLKRPPVNTSQVDCPFFMNMYVIPFTLDLTKRSPSCGMFLLYFYGM